MVFPTNKGYIKVESIEKGRGVTISKSHRISKIIDVSTLKGKTFEAEITIKDTVMLIILIKEKELAEPVPIPTFQPPYSSPKQRIKFKDWTPIGKTRMGRIYKEVVDRMLEAYKEGEPKAEDLFTIVREMYGNHLKKATIASYVSVYKKYIRENMLNPEFPAPQIGVLSTEADAVHSKEGDVVEGDIEAIVVKSPQKAINRRHKLKPDDPLSIEEVVKIWDLLEDEFVFKDVKRNLPAGIMQSTARIDAANFVIRQFLAIAEFGCEEPELGLFKKVGQKANLETKE